MMPIFTNAEALRPVAVFPAADYVAKCPGNVPGNGSGAGGRAVPVL